MGLFSRGEFPRHGAVPAFNLPVMFKVGKFIGRGFNAQHMLNFLVNLDVSAAHVMFDASSLDAGRQTGIELLYQLSSDFLPRKEEICSALTAIAACREIFRVPTGRRLEERKIG